MSNFVIKITPIRRPSAIYHIKYLAHSTADNAAVPDLPSRPPQRRVQKPTAALRRRA